jgi:hypothetical protein
MCIKRCPGGVPTPRGPDTGGRVPCRREGYRPPSIRSTRWANTPRPNCPRPWSRTSRNCHGGRCRRRCHRSPRRIARQGPPSKATRILVPTTPRVAQPTMPRTRGVFCQRGRCPSGSVPSGQRPRTSVLMLAAFGSSLVMLCRHYPSSS